MKIDVSIRKIIDDGSVLKAIASITLDDMIAIHDLKIISASGKHFVAMPSTYYFDENGQKVFRDVAHPINSDTRSLIEAAVMKEYNKRTIETVTDM